MSRAYPGRLNAPTLALKINVPVLLPNYFTSIILLVFSRSKRIAESGRENNRARPCAQQRGAR
jgi:hypothetical protein